MKNNLSQEVLKEISDKKIKPKSKILFILKEYSIWIFASISILLGSLATAVIIFVSKNSDWVMQKQLGYSFSKFLLLNIPYFWLILIIVFIFVFYKNFKHTKKGYKFKFSTIVAGTILLSIILGILFFNIGLGQAIENTFTQKSSFYNKYLNPRAKMWNKPQQGMLGGKVFFDKMKQGYKLKDLNDKEWEILMQKKEHFKNLKPGQYIRMIGEKLNGNKFEMREIK